MGQVARRYLSAQEYLAQEEGALEKHEYLRGQIFAMAGTSINHNRIVRNLSYRLTQALDVGPCEAFTADVRLQVQLPPHSDAEVDEDNKFYTYPDLMVVCGPIVVAPGSTATATNPSVIIEVLSDSTAGYDRTDKFDLYQALPSLQNYVLVEQHRPYVQCFRRTTGAAPNVEPNGAVSTEDTLNQTQQVGGGLWLLKTAHDLADFLELPALNLSLPLAQIYARVDWLAQPDQALPTL